MGGTMTGMGTQTKTRRKPKSRFAALRDRPRRASEYEELVFGLYWPDPYYVPLWDPDSTEMKVRDWRSFRDPAKFTYHKWVLKRDAESEHLKATLDALDQRDLFDRIDPRWLDAARRFLPAMRFIESAMCMSMHEVKSEALGEYLSYAISLRAFDKLGHVGANVDLCTLYDKHCGGFDGGRDLWDEAPWLQPLRRTVEHLMGRRDWGETLLCFGLVLDGLFGSVYLRHLPELALDHNDPVYGAWARIMRRQREDHRQLITAVAEYFMGQDDRNQARIESWIEDCAPMIARGCRVLLEEVWRGLGKNTPETPARLSALIFSELREQCAALNLSPVLNENLTN